MLEPGFGEPLLTVGRYAVYGEIASGGMATVHFGRLLGPAGFARTVAVKRLHPQFAKDAEFVAMFLDEARLAARIRHPNVVPTLDVVASAGEVLLIMEYVHGESLGRLLRALQRPLEPAIAVSVLAGILHGLHAAHTATSERGEPLGIVHRDVSPQNVLIGVDGSARLVDFGVAKAIDRTQTTREGQIKGKFSYMAPEQILNSPVSARTDVFAASVVLWESLCGRRLFKGDSAGTVVNQILNASVPAPSTIQGSVPPALDRCVARGLARRPADRYASAEEMAVDLERTIPLLSQHTIGKWVASVAGKVLHDRNERISAIESASISARDMPEEGKRAVEAFRNETSALEQKPIHPEGSQVSTFSVERRASLPPRRNARRFLLLSAALGLVGSAIVAGFLIHRHGNGPSEAASAAPTQEKPKVLGQAPPVKTVETIDLPVRPESDASPQTSSEPPSTPSARPHAPIRSASPVKGPPRATSDDDLMNVRK